MLPNSMDIRDGRENGAHNYLRASSFLKKTDLLSKINVGTRNTNIASSQGFDESGPGNTLLLS